MVIMERNHPLFTEPSIEEEIPRNIYCQSILIYLIICQYYRHPHSNLSVRLTAFAQVVESILMDSYHGQATKATTTAARWTIVRWEKMVPCRVAGFPLVDLEWLYGIDMANNGRFFKYEKTSIYAYLLRNCGKWFCSTCMSLFFADILFALMLVSAAATASSHIRRTACTIALFRPEAKPGFRRRTVIAVMSTCRIEVVPPLGLVLLFSFDIIYRWMSYPFAGSSEYNPFSRGRWIRTLCIIVAHNSQRTTRKP